MMSWTLGLAISQRRSNSWSVNRIEKFFARRLVSPGGVFHARNRVRYTPPGTDGRRVEENHIPRVASRPHQKSTYRTTSLTGLLQKPRRNFRFFEGLDRPDAALSGRKAAKNRATAPEFKRRTISPGVFRERSVGKSSTIIGLRALEVPCRLPFASIENIQRMPWPPCCSPRRWRPRSFAL
jgi:hypothetical protein